MRSPNTTLIKITDTQTPSSLAPPDRHNASEHCALLIDETMNAQPLRLVPQDVIDLVEFDPYPRILRFDFAWQVERQPTGLWSTLTGKNKPIDLDAACLMFDRMGGLLDTIWFGIYAPKMTVCGIVGIVFTLMINIQHNNVIKKQLRCTWLMWQTA
jgi:hypothetical protein